jgi:surfeit locus 1 family protein
MTVELFAATVDYPVQPFVILQNPGEPNGFTRQWPREVPKEGMHLGYAIQWFAFAAIAFGFYLRLSLTREEATT